MILKTVKIVKSDLSKAEFDDSSFRNCKFLKSDFRRCKLFEIKFKDSTLDLIFACSVEVWKSNKCTEI